MTLPKIYPLHTQLGAVTKENENKITTNQSNNKKKEEILQEQTSLPSKRQYPTNIIVFA